MSLPQILAIFATLLMFGCVRDVGVDVFIEGSRDTSAVTLDVRIVPGRCADTDFEEQAVAGGPAAVHEQNFVIDRRGAAVGPIDNGDYAVAVIGRDIGCQPVAYGCDDVAVGIDSEVVVMVARATYSGGDYCGPNRSCFQNHCLRTGMCNGADCIPGQACCGNECIDVLSDPMNCGDCGQNCGGADSGARCCGGECRPGPGACEAPPCDPSCPAFHSCDPSDGEGCLREQPLTQIDLVLTGLHDQCTSGQYLAALAWLRPLGSGVDDVEIPSIDMSLVTEVLPMPVGHSLHLDAIETTIPCDGGCPDVTLGVVVVVRNDAADGMVVDSHILGTPMELGIGNRVIVHAREYLPPGDGRLIGFETQTGLSFPDGVYQGAAAYSFDAGAMRPLGGNDTETIDVEMCCDNSMGDATACVSSLMTPLGVPMSDWTL